MSGSWAVNSEEWIRSAEFYGSRGIDKVCRVSAEAGGLIRFAEFLRKQGD